MKHTSRSTFWMTLIAGGLGLLLRLWLFDQEDIRGLLPSWHISRILMILLTAAYLGYLFWQSRKIPAVSYRTYFSVSAVSAAGAVLAGLALGWYTLSTALSCQNRFMVLVFPLGILSAISLFVIAWCRLRGSKPRFWLLCILTVFMMVHSAAQSQDWEHIPQLARYLPNLLASVFLMLGSYQHAAFSVQKKSMGAYIFTNQAALFFCILSLASSAWPFYLAMVLWTASGSLCVQEELHDEAA